MRNLYFRLNDNKYIEGVAQSSFAGYIDTGLPVEALALYDEDIQNGCYRFIDGNIIKDIPDEAISYAYNESVKNSFRERREEECFPIINRGRIWYDRLTEEQLAELRAWYNAWLNVTETLIIPEKPSWLENL